ncbi:MAG TPA: hypothetical protein PK170_08665 [Anaerolineae bacterium]|nr:hypothetical protein [Anaerolineae bacterium]
MPDAAAELPPDCRQRPARASDVPALHELHQAVLAALPDASLFRLFGGAESFFQTHCGPRGESWVVEQGDQLLAYAALTLPRADDADNYALNLGWPAERAGRVGLGGQAMDRLDEAADVGRAGDGHQRDAAGVVGQQAVEMRLVQPAIGQRMHVQHPAGKAGAPGQIVGMVLKLGGDHHLVGPGRQAKGELVDGLGGVLAEDHRVGAQISADEVADDLVGLVIGHGTQARLEAGAAVDAGIVGHEALHRVHGLLQHRRAGRVVQVDVRNQAAVQQRHKLVVADDAQEGVGCGVVHGSSGGEMMNDE